ncbi:hypothetical protein JCM11641_006634 [Rhodosporidiobolus odoratus]
MRLLPLLLLFPVLAPLAFALSTPDRPALVAIDSGKPQLNLFGWRRPRPSASSSSSSLHFGEEQDSRRPHLDSIDSTAAIDDEIRGRRTWSKLARLEVVEWSSEEKLEYQTGKDQKKRGKSLRREMKKRRRTLRISRMRWRK